MSWGVIEELLWTRDAPLGVLRIIPPSSVYVEPYGGSMSLLLRKDSRNIEVINERDGELLNWWSVIKSEKWSDLKSRIKYDEAIDRNMVVVDLEDSVSRAERFFRRNYRRLEVFPDFSCIDKAHRRLSRVSLVSNEPIQFLQMVDAQDMYAIIDPPDDEDMDRLLKCMTTLVGRFAFIDRLSVAGQHGRVQGWSMATSNGLTIWIKT